MANAYKHANFKAVSVINSSKVYGLKIPIICYKLKRNKQAAKPKLSSEKAKVNFAGEKRKSLVVR